MLRPVRVILFLDQILDARHCIYGFADETEFLQLLIQLAKVVKKCSCHFIAMAERIKFSCLLLFQLLFGCLALAVW